MTGSNLLAIPSRAEAMKMSGAERFDRLYIPEPNSGCWLWIGWLDPNDYGMLVVDGRRVRAHRFSHERSIGPIPDGYFVCHRCDQPSCVNPDHLFAGTATDNNADMTAKGRRAIGSRLPFAKLNAEQAGQIRLLLQAGGNVRALAKQFNVSDTAITDIRYGRTWRHLDMTQTDTRIRSALA